MNDYTIEWTHEGYRVLWQGLPTGEPPFRTHDEALAYVERRENES